MYICKICTKAVHPISVKIGLAAKIKINVNQIYFTPQTI